MTQKSEKSWAGTWLVPALLLFVAIYDIAAGLAANKIGTLCSGLGVGMLAVSLVHDQCRFTSRAPFFLRGRRTALSMPISLAAIALLVAGIILKRTVF